MDTRAAGELPISARPCSRCSTFHTPQDACPVAASLARHATGPLLPVGTVLGGRFEVAEAIHRSRTCTVYRALDRARQHDTVAIKQVSVAGLAEADRREARSWLAREAGLLSSLHDHRLPALLAGFSEGDSHYVVMEYLEGETVQERVERAGPLAECEAVRLARQLVQVLVYLHRQRPPVIHRDIKPSNVLVQPDGRVVLLDLGAARPIADRGVGTAIGTPGYAAPEQYQGIADQQTDLYGLGGTLRFACTGYDAERDGSTQLPQVQERQIGISPELRWLIGSLLELGSRDRPGTAAGVLAYIESLEDLSNARLEQTVCQGAIRRLLVGVPSLTGLAAIFLGAHRLSGTWPPDKLLWFLPAVLVVALDTVATPWVGMRSTSGALGAARRKTTRDLQWPFRIAFGSAVVLAWPGANLGVIPGAWFAVFALVVIILAVLLVRLHAASSRYATIRAAVFIEPRATPQITAPGMLPSA